MQNKDSKKRYKMYKAGKNWVVAPLVFLGLAIGAHTSQQDASADTTTPADAQATTTGNDTNTDNDAQQGTVKLQTVQQNTNTTQVAQPQAQQNINATQAVQQTPVQDQAAQSANQSSVQQAAPAQQSTIQDNIQRVTPINTPTNASEKQVNGNWYLVDNETGKNLNGFQKIESTNKVVYYSPKNNQMQYGQQKINNNWYFFDTNSGRM
ncbi:KxYKxGKxW signal peptide domain-containing protein, partial [Ligilactobacillus hayakitensis]